MVFIMILISPFCLNSLLSLHTMDLKYQALYLLTCFLLCTITSSISLYCHTQAVPSSRPKPSARGEQAICQPCQPCWSSHPCRTRQAPYTLIPHLRTTALPSGPNKYYASLPCPTLSTRRARDTDSNLDIKTGLVSFLVFRLVTLYCILLADWMSHGFLINCSCFSQLICYTSHSRFNVYSLLANNQTF